MSDPQEGSVGLVFGAVADDLTGASGLANTLVRGRLPTVLAIGVPEESALETQAVVARKTRTIRSDEAVRQLLQACRPRRAATLMRMLTEGSLKGFPLFES
jgi:uncharacterized protein YgbK (DUF1537 family)